MSLIEVHNEWDVLEEIIVGDVSFAAHPKIDKAFEVLNGDVIESGPGVYTHQFPDRVIDETREDLERLVEQLKSLTIRVRRPDPIAVSEPIASPYWKASHYFCYCPRDVLLPIGNQIIETPCVFRSRFFEVHSYHRLLKEYFRSGSQWVAAPKPMLRDELYDETAALDHRLRNHEIAFDAANCLRAGRDIFYLVADSGNELGADWLERYLGSEYRVHRCRGLNCSIHIDSTISLLRPGLALVNPERVDEENLPAPLRKWDIIWAPDMVERLYSECRPVSSKWLGMNLLMVRPDLAMVDADQTPLMRSLEARGIDVVPVVLRHGRTLGGGVHCVTLDVRRRGALEDYFG